MFGEMFNVVTRGGTHSDSFPYRIQSSDWGGIQDLQNGKSGFQTPNVVKMPYFKEIFGSGGWFRKPPELKPPCIRH